MIITATVRRVDKHGNELTIEEMIKRFNKAVERDGIMNDLKKHEFYVPKSERRRLKSQAYQKLMRKENNN